MARERLVLWASDPRLDKDTAAALGAWTRRAWVTARLRARFVAGVELVAEGVVALWTYPNVGDALADCVVLYRWGCLRGYADDYGGDGCQHPDGPPLDLLLVRTVVAYAEPLPAAALAVLLERLR